MQMNIFSSFNPINYVYMMSMMINVFFMMFMINKTADMKDNFKFLYINLKNLIWLDFMKVNKSNLSILFSSNFLIFNVLLNTMNILPYSFCLYSQYYLFLMMTLVMWMSCILNSAIFHFKMMMIHLTPLGCPLLISWLMNIIELISMMIRPITLSVRMSANLLAGHLMIHLLSEFSFFMFEKIFFSIPIMVLLMLMLNVLELAVAMIQPYIFCTLLNMYFSENS